MIGPLELVRRSATRLTDRLASLPILALAVHSGCNCRCVMCDIWKANADRREITSDDLRPHLEAIRRLRVRRVMLTGGEPLMHSNLWRLCDELKALGARITLVTTGVALEANARQVAGACDEVVVSLDGDRDVHDRIRRVRGGFDRVAAGIAALRACGTMRIAARSVVQRLNYASLPETIAAAAAIGMDRISFLAADVSSPAFNRATPWDEARRAEVALGRDDLAPFAEAIRRALRERAADFASGFVAERPEGLWRLHRYYTALAGDGPWPAVRCNAPWISAVVDPDGAVRPCFFHPPYGSWQDAALDTLLNTDAAVRFRRELDVARDGTCSRCVCTMKLPITGRV